MNPVKPLDVSSSEYDQLKRQLVWHEMVLLRCGAFRPGWGVSSCSFHTWVHQRELSSERRTFGFLCHVDLPHKMLMSALQMLRQEGQDMSALMQEAWNLACDSLRSSLCVRFRSEAIACGIIYYSSRKLGVSQH